MSKGLKFTLILLLLLLAASIPLAMQLESGAIEGTISNDTGPVASAAVEARNLITGAIFQTHADSAGYYRIGSLRAGKYSVRVEAPGHDSTWIPQVTVMRGQTAQTDIHLGTSGTPIPGV